MLLSLGKILPLTRTLVILDDLVVDLVYRDLHHDVIFFIYVVFVGKFVKEQA
jgi:hypothetical protein